MKVDSVRAAFRRGHPEAARSTWRDDFRRANPEFDKWLIDQEYNKPLPPKTARRQVGAGRIITPTASGGFVGGGVSPRRAAIRYPKFKRPRISTAMRVRAPVAPGV